MPCWWRSAEGSWDDIKSVSFLFYYSFQGEMSGKGYQGCFDGWSWSLLPPGMFWLAGSASTDSKAGLHLPYPFSPSCLFLFHLSLPFPSPFHSKLCASRELSMCTRQAQVTLGFLRSLSKRFQPLQGAAGKLVTSKDQCKPLCPWALLATGLALANPESAHM